MKWISKCCWPALLVLLAACGGSARVGTFTPQRVLAFGDETSAITPDGKKFSVNGLTEAGVFDCRLNPNWVQLLTQSFNLPFAQCNPDGVAVVSINYAAAGAKVADITLQIDQHLASGGFTNRDLVAVLAGTNDIVEQYRQLSALGEAAIRANVKARAGTLAEQVNRIARAGGKVLISTVPDLRFSPFALAEQAAGVEVIGKLVGDFNTALRTLIINDGSLIGLVQADELVQVIVLSPGFFGFADVRQAACAVAPPDCTTATLVANANAATWLWASPLLLSPGGQSRLGTAADARARNNPFQE